ncbi:ATP-dependent zinc protease family protein [Cellvibrio japonicus]|uniref:Uvs110 n=1 Tax=Cellvibrio japonicus (strain Ueda107) TaxID=498211 RepID=B3PFE5_CELJU|nr:ATP-dependent zinc protease [Cellvibrio japonicus]ACE82780.1 Uvs110 [Cellvibrio japonicus Ueda107]QEI10818.1 ATP-dependent zinc protease [Cellvibrio japonicus]QEI14394.1 ATP-dependent zinc protease [Cellvibrio japonicus]QEI17972.1 ATP-dependent zinc protease [Cellvibrio japonicus]
MDNCSFFRPGRKTLNLVLWIPLLAGGLMACSSSKQLLINQNALQQCLANQDTHLKQQEEQQRELVASLGALQQQLAEQQKVLESEPRVIEKQTTRVVCPSPVSPPAPKVPPAETPVVDKQIVGLQEQVLLTGLNIIMPTRINTNVANSVLDARNIQLFERNSDEWVRFTVYNPETKEPHVLERKRLRFQNVTTASATTERRPVVEMRFTVGKLTQKGEFVLADRSTSEFPLLIGRNLLRDVMLVDVSGNNLAPVQRIEEPAPKAQP